MSLYTDFISSLSSELQDPYQQVIDAILGEESVSFSSFEKFTLSSPEDIAEIIGTLSTLSPDESVTSLKYYYADKIKSDAENNYINTNKLRTAIEDEYYSSFRIELQTGVKDFIETLITNEIITAWEDIEGESPNASTLASQINNLHNGHALIYGIAEAVRNDARAYLNSRMELFTITGKLVNNDNLETIEEANSLNTTLTNEASIEDRIYEFSTNDEGYFSVEMEFIDEDDSELGDLPTVTNTITQEANTESSQINQLQIIPQNIDDCIELFITIDGRKSRIFTRIESLSEGEVHSDFRTEINNYFEKIPSPTITASLESQEGTNYTIKLEAVEKDTSFVVIANAYHKRRVLYFDLQSDLADTVSIANPIDSSQVIEVPINYTIEGSTDTSPTIGTILETDDMSGITMTGGMEDFLSSLSNDNTTLDELRGFGGLKENGAPYEGEDDIEFVDNIDAQTRLYSSSNSTKLDNNDQIKLNKKLFDNSIRNLKELAAKPLVDVANLTYEEAGDYNAAQNHRSAVAEEAFLKNIATGYAAKGNTFKTSSVLLDPILNSVFKKKCSCKECESGVSPLAYLADLINYAFTNLKNDGDSVDFEYLENTFLQRFKDLPATCDELNKTVCQVRICIEVIKDYLPDRGVSIPAEITNKYVEDTYHVLLQKMGTSIDEIKLIQTEDTEAKQKLADRIGIYYSSTESPDIFDRILLETTELGETALEDLFGLIDTNRDPLNDGLKLNDTQIEKWNLSNIIWFKNTDHDGYIYLNTTVSSVDVYKDASRTLLIASGTIDTTGQIKVSPENNSGLSGLFTVNGTTTTARISVVPILTARKLRALREKWLEQDLDRETPIIDPDLICPGDIIYPYTDSGYESKADADKLVIDLWTLRNDDLIAKEAAIKTDREVQASIEERIGLVNANKIAVNTNNEVFIATPTGLYSIDGTTPKEVFESDISDSKGIDFDKNNNVFIGDIVSSEGIIKKYAIDVNTATSEGELNTGYSNLHGVVIDKANNYLYASNNTGTGGISRFTLPEFFTNSDALSNVNHISTDSFGNFYIPNQATNQVLKFDEEGNYLKAFGTENTLHESLVAHWKFDDGFGITVRDNSSTSAHEGTLKDVSDNDYTNAVWSPTGKTGGSLTFNNEFGVKVSSSNDLNLDSSGYNKRTVEVWFQVNDKSEDDRKQVIYEQGGSSNGMSIYIYDNKLFVGCWNTYISAYDYTIFNEFENISNGVWHHIVIILDGDNTGNQLVTDALKIYLDGTLVSVNDASYILGTNAVGIGGVNDLTKFHDGDYSGNDQFFEGFIDNIRIWNRALTEDEVTVLYNRTEDEGGFMINPQGVSLDSQDFVYVVDQSNSKIQKFDSEGNFITNWGGYGTGSGLLKTPNHIYIDDDKQVYVSDESNNYVNVYDSEGGFLLNLDKTTQSTKTPKGVVHFNGITYVATDEGIEKFDSDGAYISDLVDSSSFGGLSLPSLDQYLDEDGEVLVSSVPLIAVDLTNNKIIEIDLSAGTTEDKIDPSTDSLYNFTDASDISIDSNGYLYITDQSKIVKTGLPQVWTDTFDSPVGLTIDIKGNIYVLEKGGDGYVSKYDASGTRDTDFDANASFNLSSPTAIVCDELDNLIISDDSGTIKYNMIGTELSLISDDYEGATGIGIDYNHQVYIVDATITGNEIGVYDAMRGIGKIISDTLIRYVFDAGELEDDESDDTLTETAITFREYNLLAVNEAQGISPSATLEEMKMNFTEYRFFNKVIQIINRGNELKDSQWDDVYAILCQKYKFTQYSTWLTEEQTAGITLSQDNFTQLTSLQENQLQLPTWKAKAADRRTWLKVLKGRISQEENKYNAQAIIVNEAEEATLIAYRDSLLELIPTSVIIDGTLIEIGNTLEKKADYFTQRYLIDAKNNCCNKVNRVSQAIETLQGVFFGIRTGQLTDSFEIAKLSITSDYYDKEWEWMGSYATWRAAMFIFMYPENLLLPSLKKEQTQAFRSFTQNIQQDSRLTPEKACEYADEYFEYFEDISKIKLEGCIQIDSILNIDELNCFTEDITESKEPTTYMFGIRSGKIYWSGFSDSRVMRWERIKFENQEINRIEGVVYGKLDHSLYLIYYTDSYQKLNFIKYDLDNQLWESPKEINLNLPDGEVGYTVIVRKTVYDTYGLDVDASDLMIQLSDDRIAHFYIGTEGIEMEEDYSSSRTVSHSGVLNNDTSYEVEYKTPTTISFSTTGTFNLDRWIIQPGNDYCYLDFVSLPNSNYIYFFYTKPNTSYIYYKYMDFSTVAMPISNEFYFAFSSTVDYIYPVFNKTDNTISIITSGNNKASIKLKSPLTNKLPSSSIPDEYLSPNVASYSFSDKDSIKHASELQLTSNKVKMFIKPIIEEVFYMVPLTVAQALTKRGYYKEALDWFRLIYDYTEQDPSKRKVYYGLTQEEDLSNVLSDQRVNDWLLDPLNPHAIASTREHSYTYYTITSLVQCFLAFADSEFTKDSNESVAKARQLYETALQLLEDQNIGVTRECETKIENISYTVSDEKWFPVWQGILQDIRKIENFDELENFIDNSVNSATTDEELKSMRDALNGILSAQENNSDNSFEIVKNTAEQDWPVYESAIMADQNVARSTAFIGTAKEKDVAVAIQMVTGIVAGTGDTQLQGVNAELPFLRGRIFENDSPELNLKDKGLIGADMDIDPDFKFVHNVDSQDIKWNGGTIQSNDDPNTGLIDEETFNIFYTPTYTFSFCMPQNPVLTWIKFSAELNLFKIRNCQNIAGVVVQRDAFAAPTDTTTGLPQIGAGGTLVLPGLNSFKPSIYRFDVLLERSKQLINIAQQVEASLLSTLEKLDNERYTVLKAKQDLALSKENVSLQGLRVDVSDKQVTLAQDQQVRVNTQKSYYDELLEDPISDQEEDVLQSYLNASYLQLTAAITNTAAAATYTGLIIGGVVAPEFVTSAVNSTVGALGSYAAQSSSLASWNATRASYARRTREWEFQRDLAADDLTIAGTQVSLAEDQVQVTKKEEQIAELQQQHAEATVEFLANKFTNAELYQWMSGVLENVYAYFLQQASATAKVAEGQLQFERQQTVPPFIKEDYWEAPSDGLGISGGNPNDRRGLTGSIRLLQDVTKLDQFAFDNDPRKLNLTKTISLSSMAPAEFQRFRETGEMIFDTRLETFDRDFPGHYLRLVKKVSTSVIALIPPTEGIKATLTNAGITYTVISGNIFQKVPIARQPEEVALTSPVSDSGVFQLSQEGVTKLLPFENMGVEGRWEFSMPKASNPFDFDSIADVLVTIEYTALSSNDYKAQVIQNLDLDVSADRVFSFKNELADQWFDLNNPDQTDKPITIEFETRREDFPPNLSGLGIAHLTMYIITDKNYDETPIALGSIDLRYSTDNFENMIPLPIKSSEVTHNEENNIFGTQRANASAWEDIANGINSVEGKWRLTLQNIESVNILFKNEAIKDIVFVLTYKGTLPEYPQ